MKVHVTVGDNTLTFTSDLARQMFFERNKGKHAYLVIDDAPTANMRRYFEGAIVPAVYYQHPNSGWADFGECREALKFEFLPVKSIRLIGNTNVGMVGSTANLTKAQFTAFIEAIEHWMVENGLEYPEPEEYKAWRDSAPPTGAIYPQLLRLKEKYDKIKSNGALSN